MTTLPGALTIDILFNIILIIGVVYIGKNWITKQNYISSITLLVSDYDEALEYYSTKLGFKVIENKQLSPTKRWIVVAPKSGIFQTTNTGILLSKADTEEQKQLVGNQTGGRVVMIIRTDNFVRDYNTYIHNGVKFTEQPRYENYGKVAKFQDLYGNLYDLLELY